MKSSKVLVILFHATAINAWTGLPSPTKDISNDKSIVTRRSSISRMVFTSIPSMLLLPMAITTGARAAEIQPSPTSSTFDNPKSESPPPSSKSDTDAFAAFGKNLNSMTFDSWDGAGTAPSSIAGEGAAENGVAPDLAGAIDQGKRKRNVGPRTHG
jgi:hypothetical protein